jgi:predicted Fe-Mo cluster-binding NifX family protein
MILPDVLSSPSVIGLVSLSKLHFSTKTYCGIIIAHILLTLLIRVRGHEVRIVIPLLFKQKERVSPYFGASSKILVADIEEGRILQETIRDLEGNNSLEIVRGLVKIGANTVICGGIDLSSKTYLIEKGITVVDNQRGVARQLLKQFSQSFGA